MTEPKDKINKVSVSEITITKSFLVQIQAYAQHDCVLYSVIPIFQSFDKAFKDKGFDIF